MFRRRNRFWPFALPLLFSGWISSAEYSLRLEATIGGKGMRCGYVMTHLIPLPDGKRLLGSARDGTVRLWDLEKNEEIRRFTVPAAKPFWNAQLHPDGKRILTAEDDGFIRLWDLEKKDPAREFKNPSRVFRLAFLPDGLGFLSGDSEDKVSIWDLTNRDKSADPAAMKGHTDDVYAVAVSRDGKRGWSGGDDKQVITWDLEKQKAIGKAMSFEDDVNTLALSPDGKWLLVVVDGGRLSLWDAGTMKAKWSGTFKSDGYVAAWTPDGAAIVTSGKAIEIISAETGKLLRSIPLSGDAHTPVAVSLDGKEIFSGESMVYRHDYATGKQIFPPEGTAMLEGQIRSLALSDFGEIYAATGKRLEIWNVQNAREKVVQFDDDVWQVRLSGDGSLAAVGTDKNAVHVLRTKDGKELAKLDVKRQVRQLEFLGEDRILVNTGANEVSVIEIKTGGTLRSFEQKSLDRVAVSPDGSRLATASDSNPLQVWDSQTGESLGSFALPGGAEKVAGIAFLSDSKSILLAGKQKLSGAFFREQKFERPISDEEFSSLVEALGQSDFWAREVASKKLVALGSSVLPMLESAKGTNPEGDYRLRLVANSLRQSLKPGALEAVLEHESDFSSLLVHPAKPFWAATGDSNPVRGHVLFGGFRDGKPVVLQTLREGRGPASLAFDRAGTRLAVGNDDGTVTVYRIVGPAPE